MINRIEYYVTGEVNLEALGDLEQVKTIYVDKMTDTELLALSVINSLVTHKISVIVSGYFPNLRCKMYCKYIEKLKNISFICTDVQHEALFNLTHGWVTRGDISKVLSLPHDFKVIGADKSVKNFTLVDYEVSKIRKGGKVVSMKVPKVALNKTYVILDDILAGGATVNGIVDQLIKQGVSTQNIKLFIIHSENIYNNKFNLELVIKNKEDIKCRT